MRFLKVSIIMISMINNFMYIMFYKFFIDYNYPMINPPLTLVGGDSQLITLPNDDVAVFFFYCNRTLPFMQKSIISQRSYKLCTLLQKYLMHFPKSI